MLTSENGLLPGRNGKVWLGSGISSNNRTVLPQSQAAIQSPGDAHPTFTPSKDPQTALCAYEGRWDNGESTVEVLFQLYRGDCECVQTGICNAIMILRKSCKNQKKKLNHWKCVLKVTARKVNWEVLFFFFFCSSLLYRCLLHCVCNCFLPVHNELILNIV